MEQIIQTITNIDYVSNLFSVWATSLIIFPTLTYAFKSRRTNWGNFWSVWFFSAVISGIILGFLIYMPNIVTTTLSSLKSYILN